jgi:hypothetical protein
VAARNLIHAIDLSAGTVEIDATIRSELIECRDLNEHWRDNLPVFLVTPRQAEPPYPSGKRFAERNPGRDPYWWLSWTNHDGPKVLPNVPASAVHDLVNRVVTAVLAKDPALARFILDWPSMP